MRLFEHLYCLNIYIGTLLTALISNRIERSIRLLYGCCNFKFLTLLYLYFKHFKMENLTSVVQHKSSQICYVGIMIRIMMMMIIIHGRETFTWGKLRYFIRHVSENKACFNLLNPKSSWTRHASYPLKGGWHRNMENKKLSTLI